MTEQAQMPSPDIAELMAKGDSLLEATMKNLDATIELIERQKVAKECITTAFVAGLVAGAIFGFVVGVLFF